MAVAGDVEFAVFGLHVVRERDEDGADGFFFSASIGAGDSRDRESEISSRSPANSLGHRFRHRRAHRTVLQQQHRLDTERARLRVVCISHDAFDEIFRRSGNICNSLRK